MSRLISIADLSRPKNELEPLMQIAQTLSQTYFNYISKDPGGFEYEVERAQPLEEMYYDSLAEGFKYKVEIGDDRKRKGGIHASFASGCMRRMVYSILDTEQRLDPESRDVNMIMRFRVGHAVHAMLQNDFERIAKQSEGFLSYTPEVRINPDTNDASKEHGIHSACDGVFTFFTRSTEGFEPIIRMGLEIKTMSDKEFEKAKKPKEFHREQATVYQACLDLPLMWTLYYNKSNSNITSTYRPFLFEFDKRLWERKLEIRFVKGRHLAVIQELPPKEEGRHCKWCAYSWTCQPKYIQSSKPMRVSRGMLPNGRTP